MSKIKEHIPDLETLRRKLDVVLESNLPDFINTTHSRREEVVGYRRYVFMASFATLAAVLALFIIQDSYGDLVNRIVIILMVIWLVILIISGREWLTNNRLLTLEMNMALVPILSNVLDRTLMYTETTDHREETIPLLRESQLLTVSDIIIEADDRYTVYGEKEVSIRELQVLRRYYDGRGREHHANLFTGVFVLAQLPFTVKGRTYISTEGDTTGFAHKTFWKNVMGRTDVEETILESNDFENDLHVATTDPTEAREILTPDFMVDLHDWWMEHKLNMRIGFAGNIMYMLLPDDSIRFSRSTTSTKLSAIERYAWTVVRPIWRSLVLIEDVKKK